MVRVLLAHSEDTMRFGTQFLRRMCTGFACSLILALPPQAHAQGRDGSFDEATTRRVIDTVSAVFEACIGIEPVYLPDCLGKGLQSGAAKISNNPAYWEAYVAMTRLSRGLNRTVRANRDESASRLRAGGVRLDAVKPEALAALAAETKDALERAKVDLQRLSANEVEAFKPLRELLDNQRPWP